VLLGLIVALVTVPLDSGTAASARRSDVHGPKPTIVLVHGAWADSSAWSAVIQRLQRQRYTVIAPPNPLRGVQSDTQYLRSVLATITARSCSSAIRKRHGAYENLVVRSNDDWLAVRELIDQVRVGRQPHREGVPTWYRSPTPAHPQGRGFVAAFTRQSSCQGTATTDRQGPHPTGPTAPQATWKPRGNRCSLGSRTAGRY
jgi:pimeloyl-ACP methyl ester carboxylesterase